MSNARIRKRRRYRAARRKGEFRVKLRHWKTYYLRPQDAFALLYSLSEGHVAIYHLGSTCLYSGKVEHVRSFQPNIQNIPRKAKGYLSHDT